MKKTILTLLALVTAFSLSACAGGGAGSEQTNGGAAASGDAAAPKTESGGAAKSVEPVTLRMAWWGGQPRHDYTLKVIELYEKANPHVTIEPEYANWDDYWKKLAPQAAANELPDIIQMDLSYLTQYGGNGQLEDLTPYLGAQIDTANISDNAIQGGAIGGQVFGFNLGVNTLQVHYDPGLLKQATGLDKLPDGWTWADYEKLALQAAQAGLYFDTGLKPEVFFNYFLRTKGETLYSADGTSLGYEDDALFVEYFGLTKRLSDAKATPKPDVTAQIKGVEDDLMVKKQAVSVWQWTNQYIGIQQVAGRELAMHPLPGPEANKGLFLKPSMFFSISKNSKQKEEAAKFISFFVNDVEANKLILGDRGVPVSSVVKEELKPSLSPEQAKVFDFVAWAESNSSAGDPPDPLGAAEVMAAFKTYDEMMKFGQISAEDAAKEFRAEANDILAKNKK
ncbi:ABC transporter substrate-binding protein [Paenibacillus sp.]|uniref:ABC transporter substrate-binding protein n=1 Tax=Paenibacillus sp. TaxID=58172 RepID=UPI002D30EEBF|nr:extracellular solute-binding protein [Paenibacillus sp.]HZG55718.1 extracellular solute-binding protein [Paenibacillus sp.]